MKRPFNKNMALLLNFSHCFLCCSLFLLRTQGNASSFFDNFFCISITHFNFPPSLFLFLYIISFPVNSPSLMSTTFFYAQLGIRSTGFLWALYPITPRSQGVSDYITIYRLTLSSADDKVKLRQTSGTRGRFIGREPHLLVSEPF